MTRLVVVGAVAFGAAVVLTPVAMAVATRTGVVDHPGPLKPQAAPVPYLGGVAVFLAALVGHSVAGVLTEPWFRYAVAASFVAMAACTLIPDRIDEDEPLRAPSKAGVFLTTLIAFFLVEMGDKTQIATVALAARFSNLGAVIAGTTCGMLLADAPMIFFCHKFAGSVPVKWVRWIAAACFAALAIGAVLV